MPALVERSHSPNTHTHRMLTRLDAYAPLAAITPFCTSSDLSHYFRTSCISLFTVYIRPCQQRDPYPFLFGSPASCAFAAFAHCGCPYRQAVSSAVGVIPRINNLFRCVRYDHCVNGVYCYWALLRCGPIWVRRVVIKTLGMSARFEVGRAVIDQECRFGFHSYQPLFLNVVH